jgi:hypothetical protein
MAEVLNMANGQKKGTPNILFGGEKPFPYSACGHFLREAINLKKHLACKVNQTPGPVFDITCDYQMAPPAARKRDHAE